MESLHVLILSVLVLTPRCALHTFSGGKVFVSLQDPNPGELAEQHVLAGASVVYLSHKAGCPIAESCKLDGPKQ